MEFRSTRAAGSGIQPPSAERPTLDAGQASGASAPPSPRPETSPFGDSQPAGPALRTRGVSLASTTASTQLETKRSWPEAAASCPPEGLAERIEQWQEELDNLPQNVLKASLDALATAPMSEHQKAHRALEFATCITEGLDRDSLSQVHSMLLTSMSRDSTWRQMAPRETDSHVTTGGAPDAVAIFGFYKALATRLPEVAAKDRSRGVALANTLEAQCKRLPDYKLKVEAAMQVNLKLVETKIRATLHLS